MNLPYDYSRCASAAGGTCPKRKTCARWMDEGHPTYQSFSTYPGGDDCYAYILTPKGGQRR